MQSIFHSSFLPILLIFCTSIRGAEFSVVVIDSESRIPLAARVYVHCETTGTDHLVRSLGAAAAVPYEKQSKANPRSVEIHTSVPAGAFVAENLPAGKYTLLVEKGKEYFPQSVSFELTENQKRSEVTLSLKRWVNMEERGWFSGETHLHRPWDQLSVVLLAEDLNVAMPITYWCIDAYEAPKPWDKNPFGAIPDRLIEIDKTHVVWPRNSEYEITKVRGRPHTLGALFILNHVDPIPLGAPNWMPIAEHARSVGALMDMDKLDWPFAMTLPHSTGATLYELANNHMWRTEFGLTKWNTEAPAFLQPPNGGKEGNEFNWLDYTLGQYYTLLNAGFRLVPTAGTASGVHPVPAGFSRVYVSLDAQFSYGDWLTGLRNGRSFVTTGPMLFARVNGQHPGATISGGRSTLQAQILSEYPLKMVDVVQNGRVIPIVNRSTTQTKDGAWATEVTVESTHETSGWLCVRCTEDRPDGRLRFAHSAPWWMEIPNKPLRLMRREKDYLVHRVQQEIMRSTGILSDSALAEYRAALRHFESLSIDESQEP